MGADDTSVPSAAGAAPGAIHSLPYYRESTVTDSNRPARRARTATARSNLREGEPTRRSDRQAGRAWGPRGGATRQSPAASRYVGPHWGRPPRHEGLRAR